MNQTKTTNPDILAASLAVQAPFGASLPGADVERIRDALGAIPPDDRDDWVKAAMAIKDEIGDAGRVLWDAWSQGAENYDARDAVDVWRSVSPGGGITIATLFDLAKQHGWSPSRDYQEPTAEEQAERQRIRQGREAQERATIEREQSKAREQALRILDEAVDAEPSHPYLARKQVAPPEEGARLRQIPAERVRELLGYAPKVGGEALEGVLLAAPIERDGATVSLELIDEAGRKSALRGRGTKSGAYWATQGLPKDQAGRVIIAEGVATTLSLAAALGCPAIAALSASNMKAIATLVHQHNPKAKIIIGADLEKATGAAHPDAVKAAEAAGGIVVAPDFGQDRPEGASDWNDAHVRLGLISVTNQIEEQIRASKPEETPGRTPPKGWKLTRSMVYEIKEKSGDAPDEYIPTCGPLWIAGRTTGAHGQWGLVLGFLDHDGHERRLALPASRLHDDPSALVGELAELGLKTIPGRERKTLAYLGAWDVEKRILSAKRLGWLEDPTGALAFVMPDRVISGDGTRELVYQPDRYSPTVKTVHASGSLEQWCAEIARPAGEHPPMLFALCAGLAPALLAFAEGADSYVLHFWGTTSRGKTTLGQLAASPWGCAADPADAPSLAFIRRWNLTGNGLEGLAEAHSDMPLVLDELGAATVGDVRPLVYQLAGGQGKTAMNSSREMREPRSWRTIAISTGEMSLHARMADPDQDGRRARSVKGGLTHRALDVEVSDIAANAPQEEREALVSGIKAACARHYGTAGPEFIDRIAAQFGTMSEARAHVRALVDAILAEIAPPELRAETRRALRRFALIAAAGELASDLGVLPVASGLIRSAAQTMAQSWLTTSSETDEDRIVASVRAFILAHESRFQRVNDPYSHQDEPVRDRVGFVDSQTGHWWFTDAGLSEAAPGNDKTTIARTLRVAGYLFTNENHKLVARASFAIDGKRPRLYAVKTAILEEKSGQTQKTGGQRGQGGQTQQPRGLEPVPLTETGGGRGGRESGTRDDQNNLVPLVPMGTGGKGTAKTQQPRGFVPAVPAVPLKNSDPEKNLTGDKVDITDDVGWF
ncbi:DUF927 domain-containing protein [Marichromatium bheemlicum]|uniref:DUF927 domain-containing protein n=1 Tax=Marichromatium bheemlicum TaxID=365339 RepID=A0ABX1I975_9GAMM|nr:DUF927 domain-containing protein [Marichromatium bheemlicum]NKN34102.1 DUF927 domain-containing protein [Marichromatium bheemlicum]